MSQKVLIIDDDEDLAELLGLLMRKNGYETEIAFGGKEAIDKARTFKPDVVIQDYMLPDMKGMDLLKSLRAEMPLSYVIIITARGNEDIAVDLLKAGAADYIKKPFDTEKLLHTVDKTLQLRYAEMNRCKLTEELAQQNRELLGLNAISAALTSDMTVKEKCDASLSIIMNTLNSDMVNVFTIEGPGGKLQLKNSMGRESGQEFTDCSLGRMTGLTSYVAEKMKPAVVLDFAAEKRFKVPPDITERGITSALAVPMMMRDTMMGVVAIYSKTPRTFPSFDIKLMSSFANLFAMALENEMKRDSASRSRQLWQTTLDLVKDNLVVVDKDFKILYANEKAAERAGHKPSELVGQTCCWMMHGIKDPMNACPVSVSIKTGEPASAEISNFCTKGDRYAVTAQPILSDDGSVLMVAEYSVKLEG